MAYNKQNDTADHNALANALFKVTKCTRMSNLKHSTSVSSFDEVKHA